MPIAFPRPVHASMASVVCAPTGLSRQLMSIGHAVCRAVEVVQRAMYARWSCRLRVRTAVCVWAMCAMQWGPEMDAAPSYWCESMKIFHPACATTNEQCGEMPMSSWPMRSLCPRCGEPLRSMRLCASPGQCFLQPVACGACDGDLICRAPMSRLHP